VIGTLVCLFYLQAFSLSTLLFLFCLQEKVIEVVSTNWQDNDARKVEEYALLSISE